jgi:hypothetical protein
VADVGEEIGLRPVQLGERLGPAALRLVAAGVHQSRGDLARQQLDEAAVGVVEVSVRVEADDEEAGGRPVLLARGGERDGNGRVRRLLPGPGGQGDALAGDVEHQLLAVTEPDQRPEPGPGVQGRRRGGRAGLDPGAGGQARAAVGIDEVDEAERDVGEVAAQLRLHRGQHIVLGAGGGDGGGEIAQRLHPALADDPARGLGDHAQHALGTAVVAVERAVGEGVIGLLGVAAALEEEQQVLVPRRDPGLQDRPDARTDVVPDLGPDLRGRAAECPRVLGLQGVPPVGVVVEEGQVRTPGCPHGEA